MQGAACAALYSKPVIYRVACHSYPAASAAVERTIVSLPVGNFGLRPLPLLWAVFLRGPDDIFLNRVTRANAGGRCLFANGYVSGRLHRSVWCYGIGTGTGNGQGKGNMGGGMIHLIFMPDAYGAAK